MRFLLLLVCCGVLCGCGSSNSVCTYDLTYTASPATATKSHLSAAPDNQQQFTAQVIATPPTGCTAKGYTARAYAVWTSTDPTNISISNAADATNGLATCTGATSGPVTLTATTGPSADAVTATTQLTCQ
ncbi:MAG: hypothetical protein ABI142_01095 [Bryocella sp.]